MGIDILEFDNIVINKKTFHKFKQLFDLLSIAIDQILVSDKFKHNNEGSQYFIGYGKELVHPLCIMLPQMSRYIKYFKNGSKNMSLIKDDEVWDKYDKIWGAIKNKLGIKFHSSEPVYEYKYLKVKVREFDGVIKTNFLGNSMPK